MPRHHVTSDALAGTQLDTAPASVSTTSARSSPSRHESPSPPRRRRHYRIHSRPTYSFRRGLAMFFHETIEYEIGKRVAERRRECRDRDRRRQQRQEEGEGGLGRAPGNTLTGDEDGREQQRAADTSDTTESSTSSETGSRAPSLGFQNSQAQFRTENRPLQRDPHDDRIRNARLLALPQGRVSPSSASSSLRIPGLGGMPAVSQRQREMFYEGGRAWHDARRPRGNGN